MQLSSVDVRLLKDKCKLLYDNPTTEQNVKLILLDSMVVFDRFINMNQLANSYADRISFLNNELRESQRRQEETQVRLAESERNNAQMVGSMNQLGQVISELKEIFVKQKKEDIQKVVENFKHLKKIFTQLKYYCKALQCQISQLIQLSQDDIYYETHHSLAESKQQTYKLIPKFQQKFDNILKKLFVLKISNQFQPNIISAFFSEWRIFIQNE